ncbi:serine hydrolase domain-containing protein [Steroidobacter flavus]|uniref:Serine hydrolase domain-containing protein n=1 Tax=Steroidobacter flavus TaxID=1842136 RepID=A0ABV8SLQ8_9GAMM
MRVNRSILRGWLGIGCALLLGTGAQADDFDGVRQQIRDAMVEQNIPSIAVAVARNSQILWEEGFGWADVAKRVPADAHTMYSLASISKPITATALMILVERGAIDLDKPMNDYLGAQKLTSPAFDVRQATVRRVANHTSGLPLHYQFFYDDEKVTRPTMDESIRRYGTLVREPGENWLYSNFGYGLLEYAIERASGKSYPQFMREELFAPLGLTETIAERPSASDGRAAERYGVGVNRHQVPFYDFDHRGASAIYMSAHDLVRFGMFHLDGKLAGQKRQVLKQATLARMLDQAVASDSEGKRTYGIGWGIGEMHGLQQFGHTGGMAGVRTQLSIYLESKTVVVILTNASGPDIRAIDNAIMHTVLPETILKDRQSTLPASLTGRWTGAVQTYTGTTPVELQVKEDGAVLARVGKRPLRVVDEVALGKDGLLQLSNIEGDVGTPDAARYPYTLSFTLKQRGTDKLNGSVSTLSRDLPDRAGNALSYWVALSKAEH